jgi:integrase
MACNVGVELAPYMALNLYRRHRADCTGKHAEDTKSSEMEERSKKWARCSCPIVAAGSLAKTFKRRKTGRIFWDEAKAIADRWETAGRWPEEAAPGPAPVPTADPSSKKTVADALESWLVYHKKNSAYNTWLRYKGQTKVIHEYSKHKGYTLIEQWTKNDILEFRETWTTSKKTANSNLGVLKVFFRYCEDHEWITVNPARKVKGYKSRGADDTRGEQKLPFTDGDLRRMYEATETYGKLDPAQAYKFSATGRDLSDFISVSIYTGLRISDVSQFRSGRMNDLGEVVIRTKKNGATVSTWVPAWLQEIIRRRSLEVGDLIFGEHQSTDVNNITSLWRRKLARLWRMCGEWEPKPTPHRFRHTFARVLLERPGITVLDVAELLGDTEQMVRKHYAAWIPGRQEKLTKILQEAFAETPRPNSHNVIEMPAKKVVEK